MLAAFTHSLAHRGPDGFGIEHFPEARLWLGHRRLEMALVTYSFALPETSKIGGGCTKRVLRQAMRGLLLEPIR